jgi:predicted nucleic acid-binding protein
MNGIAKYNELTLLTKDEHFKEISDLISISWQKLAHRE